MTEPKICKSRASPLVKQIRPKFCRCYGDPYSGDIVVRRA